MDYENILVDIEEGVATITINRPQVLNALSQATIEELTAALGDLGGDDTVRAIIISGAGERAFSAGADIKELAAIPTRKEAEAMARRGQSLTIRIEELPKPVIAAINGIAVGGGCELALACDLRVAAETARLGQPEINLGIIPGWGGCIRLPRLVGRGMANYLIYSGEIISAQEALRIGLVDMVFPAAEFLPQAKALAHKLAEKPPLALSAAKRTIHSGLAEDPSRGLEHEAGEFGRLFDTADRQEGMAAFLEKRKPNFQGK
ncbi:MAG: enoyl-CoA hydratase/isomerase family protein [Chloroflexi bacterium]|nr:enoyl-CoA hydratase/isomerase family protein [Chloroflexota bacterium]